MIKSKEDIFYPLALLALILGLYLPQILMGLSVIDQPDKMDVTFQIYQFHQFYRQAYLQGEFPLWVSHSFCGMPLIAYSHVGGLYPVSMIIYYLWEFFNASNVTVLAHAILTALCAYALARSLSLSPLASFLTGAYWPVTGMVFFMINQRSNVCTISWLPLLILLVIRLHRGISLRNFIFLGLVWALMVYGGDVESVIYSVMTVGLLIILYLYQERSGKIWLTGILAGSSLVLAFCLATAQSLPLLELTGQSIRGGADPSGVTFGSQVSAWYLYLPQAFFPFKYFSRLSPHSNYNQGLTPVYQGLMTILLGLCSVAYLRREPLLRRLWLIIICLFLYLIIMDLEPLQPLTTAIPIIGKLSSRARILEPIQLFTLLLAGRTLDIFRMEIRTRKTIPIAAMLFIAGIAVAGLKSLTVGGFDRYLLALVLIAAAGGWIFFTKSLPSQINKLTSAAVIALFLCDAYLLALYCVPRNSPEKWSVDPKVLDILRAATPRYRFISFQRVLDDPEHRPEINSLVSVQAGADTISGLIRLPVARVFELLKLIDPRVVFDPDSVLLGTPARERMYNIFDLASPGFINPQAVNLLNMCGVRYVLTRDISFRFSTPYPLLNPDALPDRSWKNDANIARSFQADGSPQDLIPLPNQLKLQLTFTPGMSMSMHQQVRGNAVAIIQAVAEQNGEKRIIYQKGMFPHSDFAPLDISVNSRLPDKGLLMLNLLGLGRDRGPVVLGDLTLNRDSLPYKRIYSGRISVYENREALPRSYLVHRARLVRDKKELQNILTDSTGFDPRQEVLLEKEQRERQVVERLGRSGPEITSQERVSMPAHKQQQVRIHADVQSPGYLVLMDTYYPGWFAEVNDKPAAIVPADLAFRAIPLMPGGNDIRIFYRPWSFRIGLWFTLSSLALTVLALIFIKAGTARAAS